MGFEICCGCQSVVRMVETHYSSSNNDLYKYCPTCSADQVNIPSEPRFAIESAQLLCQLRKNVMELYALSDGIHLVTTMTIKTLLHCLDGMTNMEINLSKKTYNTTANQNGQLAFPSQVFYSKPNLLKARGIDFQTPQGLGSTLAHRHLCRYEYTDEGYKASIENDLNTRVPIAQIAEIFERVPWFATGLYLCFREIHSTRGHDARVYHHTLTEKHLFKGSILALNTTQTVHPGCYRNWINKAAVIDLTELVPDPYENTASSLHSVMHTKDLMNINTEMKCKRYTQWKKEKTKRRKAKHPPSLKAPTGHSKLTRVARTDAKHTARKTSISDQYTDEDTSSQNILPSSTEPSRGNTPIKESRPQRARRLRREAREAAKKEEEKAAKVSTHIPRIQLIEEKLKHMELMIQQRTPMPLPVSSTSTSSMSTSPMHIAYPQQHVQQNTSVSSSSVSTSANSSVQHHAFPQHHDSMRSQQYEHIPNRLPTPMQMQNSAPQSLSSPAMPVNMPMQQQNWPAHATTRMRISRPQNFQQQQHALGQQHAVQYTQTPIAGTQYSYQYEHAQHHMVPVQQRHIHPMQQQQLPPTHTSHTNDQYRQMRYHNQPQYYTQYRNDDHSSQ